LKHVRIKVTRLSTKEEFNMKWDLTVFYETPDIEKIKKDLEDIFKRATNFVEKYEKLINENISAEQVRNYFKEFEQLMEDGLKPIQYSSLLFSENTTDKVAQQLYGISEQYGSKISEILSPLQSAFAQLSEEKLDALSKEIPEYSYAIEKIKLEKKHILSKDAERILAATSISRRDALSNLYEKLTSSYRFKIEIDGEEKELSGSQIRALRRSPDGNLRKKAMKLFFERYKADEITIGETYNIVVKDYDTEARLRNYPKPISMRNLENAVSDESVEKLIEITTENTNIVHKYYKWKAQEMNEELTLADIYAPFSSSEKKYTFDEAKEIVLDAYYSFDEKAGKIVESFFKENRIHSEIVPGKVGGAFCSYYTTQIKPFVLLNFNGNINDVMTLAHELGHGLHGTLSQKQSFINYHTPLTMAELASVFGEFLVFDKIKNELEGKEKKYFIASTLEDTFATMFRQNMFARFEIQAHELIEKNGMASFEELSKLYENELKIMFADSVKIPEEYTYEWSSIPHIFHTPFYVYAYNYANCLVIGLYQKYLEMGKKFVPKYIELLESGGKDSPEKLLNKIGIDITKEEFWQGAFEFLNNMLNEII
jgi:oligoendopeptidase F